MCIDTIFHPHCPPNSAIRITPPTIGLIANWPPQVKHHCSSLSKHSYVGSYLRYIHIYMYTIHQHPSSWLVGRFPSRTHMASNLCLIEVLDISGTELKNMFIWGISILTGGHSTVFLHCMLRQWIITTAVPYHSTSLDSICNGKWHLKRNVVPKSLCGRNVRDESWDVTKWAVYLVYRWWNLTRQSRNPTEISFS